MTQLVSELYTALLKAGVDDDAARAAAVAVMPIEAKSFLATKTDVAQLEKMLAEMKADIIKWNLTALGVLTVIYAGINTLLRFRT
jgi:hypothetical protein